MHLCLSIVLLNLFNMFDCLSLEQNKFLEENNIELLNTTNPIRTNDVTGNKYYFILFSYKIN